MSQRAKALAAWLEQTTGVSGLQLVPASGDASFRRYYRVLLSDNQTRVVMDAPPEQEDCAPFVDIANRLERAGLNVPPVYAADLEQGFLLLGDLGSEHYLDVLNPQNADFLYGEAIQALQVMQTEVSQTALPGYSRKLLLSEMGLFSEWLVGHHLGLELNAEECDTLQQIYELLIESAEVQPHCFVHRDYHSRNLLLAPDGGPGILDFQDAIVGPITYDLVSLLRDCYIRWPKERVESWALDYYRWSTQIGLLPTGEEKQFMRWFDLMGVQRHLKAAGIFARLFRRDEKDGYLKDIPRTLGYVVELAVNYPELAGLARLIEKRVLPPLSSG